MHEHIMTKTVITGKYNRVCSVQVRLYAGIEYLSVPMPVYMVHSGNNARNYTLGLVQGLKAEAICSVEL